MIKLDVDARPQWPPPLQLLIATSFEPRHSLIRVGAKPVRWQHTLPEAGDGFIISPLDFAQLKDFLGKNKFELPFRGTDGNSNDILGLEDSFLADAGKSKWSPENETT